MDIYSVDYTIYFVYLLQRRDVERSCWMKDSLLSEIKQL